jgi:hypothetical protein
MTYEEAKECVDKLIGPYTEEEHCLYLADIGDFENYNIVAKHFKMKIPPRLTPGLGPQLVLPDRKSLGRLDTCSQEPVGSSKRDNVRPMPKPLIVLGMKAANSVLPGTKHQREKQTKLPDLEPEKDEPCKAKRKRRRKKAASPSNSPLPVGDDLTLPEGAQQETIDKAISGDLSFTEVPPSSSQEKTAMDTWVQARLRDVLGDDDDMEVLLESPLISGFIMDRGSEYEKGAMDQSECFDVSLCVFSPSVLYSSFLSRRGKN